LTEVIDIDCENEKRKYTAWTECGD